MRALLLAVLVLASCGAPPASRQAPDFSLKTLDGKIATLAELRGKPVLLNFWATWCESCKEEMPALEALHKKLGGKAALLGASMDSDFSKDVPPFARKYGLTFPLIGADDKTMRAYAVRSLPATFLIDAEGRIVRRWLGPLDARAVENDILAQLDRRPR